ncbi:hypothetical protein [Occallatibacter riparius]|uniref:Uncharacterized protein n=1 Tax=Occallatibacter riparius TaxID=1002689 RepID=A0A9J7BQB2_9BACT|nr:hypothetical protein [Occallatibacter riparius]UWZ84745.1 hypothetical protein MOP44_02135 [Occallatibacter riparius]
MSKIRKRPTIRLVDTLIEELEGIRDLLPTVYMEDEEEDDEGEGGPIKAAGKIDSEEIEVALSALVSSISEKLDLRVEPSSFSDLLEALFSPEDDLVSLAVNLEDAINGYFGELFGENLDLADTYFGDLIALLKERREKWKRPKP